jgi:exonuclease SbcD
MRLLHTSDWHLGQTLHDFDRSHEHQAFLDWLLATIVTEKPDALLIAGDVFDNANPSATAQRQLYRFLTATHRAAPNLSIVMIAGNHDSAGRLEATAPFLDLFDAVVIGQVHRLPDQSIDVERMVVPLRRADGTIGAWCVAIPFLRPSDVPRVDDAADPYLAGVAELYRQAWAVAQTRREPGQAIVAMGHCHMVDGEVSEQSERRIVVGGAEALPTGIFDPAVAYVALGHLHKAQRVGGREHIRYCGSPLPLSFAEIHYPHQVVCVDLDGDQTSEIRSLRVPRSVELQRIPERHAPVAEVLPLLEQLQLTALAGQPVDCWPIVEVRVLLDAPEPGLRARVEAALADKPVRLGRIDPASARAERDTTTPTVSLEALDKLAPHTVFARLCEQRLGGDDDERTALLQALMTAFVELEAAPDEDTTT